MIVKELYSFFLSREDWWGLAFFSCYRSIGDKLVSVKYEESSHFVVLLTCGVVSAAAA